MNTPVSEDKHVEFKTSFNDTVIESLTAFANTSGGKVYVGLSDKGKAVKGFQLGAETLQKWVNEVKNKTQPSVIPDANIIEIDGVKIVELTIKELPIKPVSFKGRYYKRVNNSNHLMTLSEISNMHLRSFQSSWDSYINPERSIGEISLDKVNQFIESCNTDRQYPIMDDPLTVLSKYELIKEGQVTNACYLLFSQNDVFQAAVELGRFSTPTSIKDGLTVRSDLFTEVELILEFIRKHINKSYIITGDPKREERWQYPMDAIREIVINMIVHRDYMDSGDSVIKVYDNSIEFFNPGRLADNITVDQLLSGAYSSWARNKRVSATFKEAHFIEKYGSGIKRISEGFASYGLVPPVFENFQNGFKVVVSSTPLSEAVNGGVSEGVNEGVSGGVNEGVNLLFHYIKSNPGKRAPSLATELSVPVKTIERWLKSLRDDHKIEFRGAPKSGGYWAN